MKLHLPLLLLVALLSGFVAHAADQSSDNVYIEYINTSTGINSATLRGSAIFSDASLQFEDGKNSIFQQNGILIVASNSDFYNRSANALGGAVYSAQDIDFRNGNVYFADNYADSQASSFSFSYYNRSAVSIANGGAIYTGIDLTVDNVYNATFSGNYTYAFSSVSYADGISRAESKGGAIYATGDVTISNCLSEVNFLNNYAHCSGKVTGNTTSYPGGAAYGGAIYSEQTISLYNNAYVLFEGNSVNTSGRVANKTALGGAIFTKGSVSIVGNDAVVFQKNYETLSSCKLRSIYLSPDSSSDSLVLAAKTGGHITFYDSVCMDYYTGAVVSFNADYLDADGVTKKAGGDIIFSGEYTAEHLRKIKGDGATLGEVTTSQTSEINNLITLYGGTLQVVDGAKLNGRGLTAEADSGSLLLLRNGSMSHSGYNFSLNSGTSLVLQDVNVIEAAQLILHNASNLVIYLDDSHLNESALSLSGTLNVKGTLTLTLDLRSDKLQDGKSYQLLHVSAYDSTQWTDDTINVVSSDGAAIGYGNLAWENNVLYLNFSDSMNLPPLRVALWTNESSDGLWNFDSLNWMQDDVDYAYKDGVQVVFGDEGSGTVTIEANIAPQSVLVDSSADYTWLGDGGICGAANLIKQSGGTLTINNANSYNGGTIINGGKIVVNNVSALGTGYVSVNGGALEIEVNGFTNVMSFAGNSGLIIGSGITYALQSSLSNSGALVMTGSFNADALAPSGTIAATRVDLNGNKGNSGFAQSEGFTLQVVNGGTVNDDAATITYNGAVITLDNSGLATVDGGIQYNQYHIASGHTASVSAIAAKASSMGIALGNISLATGGTLNADATATVNATGGTIKLTAGTLSGSLQNINMMASGGSISGAFSGNSTLTGSNYALSSALKNNGTLTLSGSFKADALSKELTGVDVRVDVDGNEGGTSGFLRTGDFTVMISNGTVNSNNASVSYKGQVLSMTGGVGYGIGTVDYSNYLLTDGNSASVSDISDAANRALKDISMTGGNLTVDDSVVLDATGGNIIITNDSTLSGSIVDADITTVEGEYNSVIDAVIGGESSLTVNGGTITVMGDNSYTGGTTIEGGRLEVGHANALGAGDVALNGGTLDLNSYPVGNDIFATGGTLEGGDNFGGKLTVNGDLTLGGETTAGGGILLQGGSISGGSIVDTDITVDGSGDMEISSDIRGNSSLTLNNGDLTISGNNNDYTGGTTINKGSLTIGSGSSLGSGDITLNGGTLNTNGQEITNNIVNNGGTLISSYILGEGHTLTVGKGGMSVVGNLTLAGGNLHFKGMPLTVDGKVTSTAPIDVLVCGYGVIDEDGMVQLADFGNNTVGVTAASFNNVGYGTLSYDKTKNTLSITLTDKNIWVGGKGATWIQGTNVGWADGKTFLAGNRAVFNMKGTVTITGAVEPASALVDVEKSLTFKTSYSKKTGLYSGSIVGKGCIVKRGAGKLTMNDGNTYSGGTFIEAGTVNAKGVTSFGTGAITLSGGMLNLASKAVANDIVLTDSAIIKGGKKFLGTYTQDGGELMKGSLLNIAESATISGGVVNGTLSGVGTVSIDGDVELGKYGKITTNNLLVDGTLSVSTKGLAMSTKTSALTVTNGSSLISEGALKAAALTVDGGVVELHSAKKSSIAITNDTNLTNGADVTAYATMKSANLIMEGSQLTLETPRSNTWSFRPSIGGSSSTATTSALSLTVKGNMGLTSSVLTLSGKISAGNLTVTDSYINMTSGKLQTIAVRNTLTLSGKNCFIFDFDAKDGKSYKLFTYKNYNFDFDLITELFGWEKNNSYKLTADTKAITLTVNDAEAWEAYMDTLASGAAVATLSEDDELVESSGAFVLARPAAAVDPMLGKVADTLVQSTWGTTGASRAFGDTIAARGTHATALADGEAAAWISTMGGSSRLSSDGDHAGADYTLTGAAFGMEASLSEKSTVGLAIGNSWGKVSTFSAFPVDQDSTHQGIYGKHLLGSSTSLSWMAAHTRTESDGKIAGMACDWTQDALQLDARVDKLFAISDRTTVSAFVGMQYLATDKGECNGMSTGSLQNLRGEIGVSAAHQATDKAYVYGELSFIGDMVRHNPTATVGDHRSRGANPGRAGLNLSVGASYQLNDSWSLNGSYGLELMQNQTSHSANVGATYSF